jgi:hypothetical protein
MAVANAAMAVSVNGKCDDDSTNSVKDAVLDRKQ